jgi:outer membrane protein assembly factor BamD
VRILLACIVCCSLILLAGCGSSKETGTETVEHRFAHAKALFDDGDYLEAINEFTVITLQYQGSAYAAQSQYYLGECRFRRGEYLLAAFEYSLVRRNFPASPEGPDAQYKLGLSYFMLSPTYWLDQQYTKKAIDELQTFVEYYPTNEHVADADAKIKELTTRLAKKEYETARLYQTMEFYKAALFYYDDVIEKYHDTEYAPLSYLEKAGLLLDRKKYAEAMSTVKRFIDLYPNSVLRHRADEIERRIREQEPSSQTTAESSSSSFPGRLPRAEGATR